MTTDSASEKYELITHGLQEVIGGDYLLEVLKERPPNGYWGTAPTGRIHIGYLCPAMKLRDIVNADCNLTILIADMHAFLDNLKTPFERIKARTKYYIKMIQTILTIMGVDHTKVKFVVGSDYQLTSDVTLELFKLASVTKLSDASKAGTEVVKQTKDPFLTSLLYPLLQALDEKFLNADFEIGGIDQRKIFTYGKDFLPKIGIVRRFTHLMNPIVPGLSTKKSDGATVKMSASDTTSKIDLLDTPEDIKKKVSKSYCLDGDAVDNSCLQIIKNLVFPLVHEFIILRSDDHGGNLRFADYTALETMVGTKSTEGGIHPVDLKNSLSAFLIDFLAPIREAFSSEECQEILKEAYDA